MPLLESEFDKLEYRPSTLISKKYSEPAITQPRQFLALVMRSTDTPEKVWSAQVPCAVTLVDPLSVSLSPGLSWAGGGVHVTVVLSEPETVSPYIHPTFVPACHEPLEVNEPLLTATL